MSSDFIGVAWWRPPTPEGRAASSKRAGGGLEWGGARLGCPPAPLTTPVVSDAMPPAPGTTPGGSRRMASLERVMVVDARGGGAAVGRPPKGPGRRRGTLGAAVVDPSRLRAAALAKDEAQRAAPERGAWEQIRRFVPS